MEFRAAVLTVSARAVALFVLAIVLYGAHHGEARAQEPARVSFDIEAATMTEALHEYAEQSGLDVLFVKDRIKGALVSKVKGQLSNEEALRLLLARSDLCFVFSKEHPGAATVGRCSDLGPPPQRVVKPESSATPGQRTDASIEVSNPGGPTTVLVTGSNIPRPEPDLLSGPVPIVLTYDDLLNLGVITLSDLGRILPQFFGGGPAQDTHLVGTEARTNTGLGAAYNLRGLGASATLVLVNGRRLAPSGSAGSFVDNLNIPMSAVKQVEILTDGVSALYGADAVAGVVNIITRDGKDSGETTLHAGAVTPGAWREAGGSQSWSNNWNSGDAFGSLEYFKNTALPERDRGFGNSNLSTQGGPDWDTTQSWPPNIVVGKNTWAVPSGLTQGLPSLSELHLGSQNEEDIHSNSDLWPSQQITRAYGQVEQALGEHVTVIAETMLSHRAAAEDTGGDRVTLTFPNTSPYHLGSIAQGNPMAVETDLASVLGPEVSRVNVNMMSEALTVKVDLGPDSSLKAAVSRAIETEHQSTTGYGIPAQLTDPAIGFNPFVPGGALSTKMLSQVQTSTFFNQGSELHQYSLLWVRPIVNHDSDTTRNPMAALGVEYRTQSLHTADIATLLPSGPYNRRTKAVYAEVTLPLGQEKVDNKPPLELAAAGRYEDYSDFGHAAVPRLALRWTPLSGWRFLASIGQSIRTPNLPDLNTSRNTVTVGPPPSGAGDVIYISGNYGGLKEEKATNAALEAIWSSDPSPNPAVRIEAQAYAIDYYGRIQSPDLSEIGTHSLFSPTYSSFVTPYPSSEYVSQLCRSRQLYGKITAAQCAAGSYLAVIDLRLKNNDSLVTQGLDLQGRWTTPTSWGTLTVKEIGTYIFRYADKSTPTASFESLLNTQNNPINLQAHATVSTTWQRLAAEVTTNFSHGYRDVVSKPARPVGSWTTFDLQVSYVLAPEDRRDHGWIVELGVQNIKDSNPPFLINYVERLGYDEENADPLGRVLTLRLRKKW